MSNNVGLRSVLAWTAVILAVIVAGFLIAVRFKPYIYSNREPDIYSNRMPALSADEIAKAMKSDEYFADYGTSWVLVGGVIDSIDFQTEGQIVTFRTNGVSKVRCRVRDVNLRFRKNVTTQLQAIGAHRDGQDVTFDDCRNLI